MNLVQANASTLQPHGCSRMFQSGHCKKGLFIHQEFVTEIGFLGNWVVLATMFLRLQTRKAEEKVTKPYIHTDGGGGGGGMGDGEGKCKPASKSGEVSSRLLNC